MSSKNKPPKCHKNGYLVNASTEIPADPKIYYTSREQPLIGCNRIWCSRCENFVRNWPGYCLQGRLEGIELTQDQRKLLYETSNPNSLPFLSAELCSRSRVYACICHEEEISGVQCMEIGLWIMDHFDYEYWGCGGHPSK